MIAQELQNDHYLALVQGPLLCCVGIIASETDERSEGCSHAWLWAVARQQVFQRQCLALRVDSIDSIDELVRGSNSGRIEGAMTLIALGLQ